jgi:undecaprenyl diphosphate synthase
MTPDPAGRLPNHIAVIMDGNNRWAKARGLAGTAGHRAGAEAARDLVDSCINRNINYLTLFAFSNENWMRPKKEVRALMSLFLAVLKRKELEQFSAKQVRIQFIGRRDGFSDKILQKMAHVEETTRANRGLTVTVAADYGGRWDIAQAAATMAAEVKAGELQLEQIDVEAMQQRVCLADVPEPDLCIRTGGEHRISNFLLWQFAYTELYFTDCFWPDFDDDQFQLALDDFASRQRRFGKQPDSD